MERPRRPRPTWLVASMLLLAGGGSAQTTTAEVRVDVRRFVGSVQVPVSGIRVAIGLRSRAKAPDDLPLELHAPVRWHAESDADGALRLPVELTAEELRMTFWARVETPEYARTSTWVPISAHGEPARLFVQPGGTLLGRVLDEDGEPVEGAELLLFDGEAGGRKPVRTTRTLPGGHFALHFRDPEVYGLHARHAEHGSVMCLGIELDPLRAAKPVELRLGGGHDVRGVVRDRLGEPVAGAWVAAFPAGAEKRDDWITLLATEEYGGIVGATARTGEDGRYVLHRVVAGSHELVAGARGDPRRTLDASARADAVRAGGLVRVDVDGALEAPPLRLDAHRIEVRVVDEEGRPVSLGTGASSTLDRVLASLSNLDDARPLTLHDAADPFPPRLPHRLGDLLVFPVEPGHEYVLRWKEGTRPLVERRVAVPEAPFRIPVTLALAPAGAPGSLALRFTDPDGLPFERPIVVVSSADTGLEVAHSVRPGLPPMTAFEGSSWELALAPGRYVVRASSLRPGGCLRPPELPRVPYLPAENEVVVHAGTTTRLDLAFAPAGHLDLVGDVVPTYELRASVVDLLVTREAADLALALESDDARVAITRNEVFVRHDGGEGGFRNVFDRIAPGWSARCLDPLPPGEWTLVAERDGETVLERPVRIEAGSVTTVRW